MVICKEAECHHRRCFLSRFITASRCLKIWPWVSAIKPIPWFDANVSSSSINSRKASAHLIGTEIWEIIKLIKRLSRRIHEVSLIFPALRILTEDNKLCERFAKKKVKDAWPKCGYEILLLTQVPIYFAIYFLSRSLFLANFNLIVKDVRLQR